MKSRSPLVAAGSLAAALGLAAAFLAAPARAAINADDQAELAFTLWDPVKQHSYTLDLGIDTTQFYNYGQADAGYQHFWVFDGSVSSSVDASTVTRINGDTAFRQLFNAGSVVSDLRWSVLAADSAGTPDPDAYHIYTTLVQGPGNGVRNPYYDLLLSTNNGNLQNTVGGYRTLLIDMTTSSSAYNTQQADPAQNGSGYYTKGQKGYWDAAAGYNDGLQLFNTDGQTPAGGGKIMNAVGKSSWFYKLTYDPLGSYDSTQALGLDGVDEFDNGSNPSDPSSGHDGYWGFAQDPNNPNAFVLSYTIASALMRDAALTVDGQLRASQTEFAAGGISRFVASPLNEFAGYVAKPIVSAVPEPTTWALWLGGLGVIFLLRRRTSRDDRAA